MNNPYTPHSPVRDAGMFFGRAAELREIGAFLNGNQSVSIVGPRHIGKTSLLWHILRGEARTALGNGETQLFVYIDCQSLSGSPKEQVFAHFIAEIAHSLDRQGFEPEPVLTAAGTNPTWPAVEAVLRKLNQRGLRVALMLDDFECLTQNPCVDVGFYNALRSAAGRLRLAFLACSTRPLYELTCFDPSQKILSSPFFNIFAQCFLGLLSEAEAHNLIRTPLAAAGKAVSSQLVEGIYQLAGGHPLALQFAGAHAWEDREDFPKVERQTRQDLEPYFQSIWQDLRPGEREALCDPGQAIRHAAGNPAFAVILRDLVRKCLLVQENGIYRYSSKAWAEFITATKSCRLG